MLLKTVFYSFILGLILYLIIIFLRAIRYIIQVKKAYTKIYALNKPVYVNANLEKINDIDIDDLSNGFKYILYHNLSSCYIIRKPGNVIVVKSRLTDSKEIVLIYKNSIESDFWYLYLATYFSHKTKSNNP